MLWQHPTVANFQWKPPPPSMISVVGQQGGRIFLPPPCGSSWYSSYTTRVTASGSDSDTNPHPHHAEKSITTRCEAGLVVARLRRQAASPHSHPDVGASARPRTYDWTRHCELRPGHIPLSSLPLLLTGPEVGHETWHRLNEVAGRG